MPNDRQQADLRALKSPRLLALGAIFLVSGSVALVYEAAWQREFTLLFGSSAPATAVVLAAYFTGLGLGSFLLGKLGSRLRNPLAVYGLLEVIIGLGALLVRPILSSYADVYPSLFARFEGGSTAFLIAKGSRAFAAIAIPTLAMGGTFPVLAQIFGARRERFGELAGWLYALNTAGAACGVAAFPFLLRAFGMETTVNSCAALNLGIGAVAFLLARKNRFNITPTAQPPAPPHRIRVSWSVLLALFSGFVIFVLQVGWSRAFAQVHENSIYSFSFIVALFIVAIAVGAQLARVLLRRKSPPELALSRAWCVGGLLTISAPFIFLKLSDGLKYSSSGPLGSNMIVPGLVVIFIPVAFLSTGLPLILQQMANASKRAAGDLTGMVLAANIAGSVSGALAGGFLFPAALGMWRTIILMGAMVLTVSALLSRRTIRARASWAIGSAVIGGLMLIADPSRTRIEAARGEKLLALEEGPHGVVAVVERSGSRRLKLNNYYVLGGTAAIGDERMQAHIPLLLHPKPKKVAFLGYGTGITAGTVAYHPVNEPVALELVPQVVELAGKFFAEVNSAATGSTPRVVIEDARNFLRGTKERYDVIIGDLVVPWRHGEGALYTLEQFEIGRERLAPGGLYGAWLPMFQLNREDFELILRTFRSVFPNVSIWRGDFSPNEPALALIGSENEHLNTETVQRRVNELRADRFNPQLKHARAFWMHFVGVASSSATQSRHTEILNAENRPLVELRRGKLEPFVGRALQIWENELRLVSGETLKGKLAEEALRGWEAGALMTEFTHLTLERRAKEAAAVQQRLRDTLGEQVAQSIFGQ